MWSWNGAGNEGPVRCISGKRRPRRWIRKTAIVSVCPERMAHVRKMRYTMYMSRIASRRMCGCVPATSMWSPDPKLRRIWEVAEHTFRLCSGIFFLDGVKRDRWIWGGDAYQSMFVNRCLFQDADIDRRTYRALFGNAPAVTHINTILDYSLLCVIGVKEHYAFYQDRAFLAEMFPKMESVMALCGSQEQEQGFVTGRERDWEFIDWADFDRAGPLAAEQMLYAAALNAMEQAAAILDLPDKVGEYRERYA